MKCFVLASLIFVSLAFVLLQKLAPPPTTSPQSDIPAHYARGDNDGLLTWVVAPKLHEISFQQTGLPLNFYLDNNAYIEQTLPQPPLGLNFELTISREGTTLFQHSGQVQFETLGKLYPGERTGSPYTVELPPQAQDWQADIYTLEFQFFDPGPKDALRLHTCLTQASAPLAASEIDQLFARAAAPAASQSMTVRAWVNQLLVPLIRDRWIMTALFVLLLGVGLYDMLEKVEWVKLKKLGPLVGTVLVLEVAFAVLGIFSAVYFAVEEIKLVWQLVETDDAINLFQKKLGIFNGICLVASIVLVGMVLELTPFYIPPQVESKKVNAGDDSKNATDQGETQSKGDGDDDGEGQVQSQGKRKHKRKRKRKRKA